MTERENEIGIGIELHQFQHADPNRAGHEPVRIGSNDLDRFEPIVEPGVVYPD